METTVEKKEIKTYEQAVEYVLNIPKFTSKNDMAMTKNFLMKLGDPAKDMKIIHIAGTNGKGSVCAYLCAVLEEAGFSTGMFTSPHLVDVRERFRANGRMIEKERFLKLFLKVYEKLEGEYHPTFFEYMFFIAILFFQEKKVDYCILETGLGGRLDATNSVEKKEIAVITKIGFDHMEYLGNTLRKIAGEKAGIIRENTPVVYYAGRKEVNEVIEETAAKKGCEAVPVVATCDAICKNTNKSIDFSFNSRYYGYVRLSLSTGARYQVENAMLAITTLETLGLSRVITKAQLTEGMRKAFWEGRMEEVKQGVFVDGAHNEDGIEAFLDTVRGNDCEGARLLLFSAVRDKRLKEMVSMLEKSGLFSAIGTAPLANGRTVTAEEMKDTLGQYRGCRHIFYETVEEGFEKMQLLKGEEDHLYIVGSLYLVGQVKAYMRRQTDDQF